MEENMEENSDLVQRRIIRDMSEGVIVVGMNGRIQVLNPAAAQILSLDAGEALGQSLTAVFFQYEENDAFYQTFLDAIYETGILHSSIVPYYNGSETRRIQISTSFLIEEGQKVGVIAVLSDVSELLDLRDELERKNQQITALLDSLVKALAKAIDERSHYNANHTRNMVLYAEAFLDWLDRTENPWRFDAERRAAFLMSVWLHDVGKLTVPLYIMDKPTRLGERLETVRTRFQTMHYLDRIALLEGRFGEEEYGQRERERQEALALIERVNESGFLPEDVFAQVEALFTRTFTGEDGAAHPWLTEEERDCLSIRRGTLTDEERRRMQSHASVTRRILREVSFPESYKDVPHWASSHHELLNGQGYPDHLAGGEIPREVRLLTILDIFEALTAKDRPYKKPIPLDRALGILHGMTAEGGLDGALLALFEESKAWEGAWRSRGGSQAD